MQATDGASHPSVNTAQLVTTSILPSARRSRIKSRSPLGVEPSTCSARAPDFQELVPEVDRVRHAGCEDHRPEAVGMPVPVRDDVADQLGLVHTLCELRLDIIPFGNFHALEIGVEGAKTFVPTK